MGRYETAGEIINRAAREVGLTPVDDPFASYDPGFLQLIGLLTSAGQELALSHEWPQLTGEKVITTIAGKADYALPQDFLEMINQSGWNRTTRFPLGGPLGPSEWQYLKASPVVSFYALFRCSRTNGPYSAFSEAMRLVPTPGPTSTVGVKIAFEYRSRNWVSPLNTPIITSGAGESTVTLAGTSTETHSVLISVVSFVAPTVSLAVQFDGLSASTSVSGAIGSLIAVAPGVTITFQGTPAAGDTIEFQVEAGKTVSGFSSSLITGNPSFMMKASPTASSDLILYEPLLMVRALKLQFMGAKGLDTSIAAQEYQDTFDSVRGGVEGAPRLSLNRRAVGDRLIDVMNLPITGYGH